MRKRKFFKGEYPLNSSKEGIMNTDTRLVSMTLDQVRAAAPSVFADHPWEGVSERYAFIPTSSVVESLIA